MATLIRCTGSLVAVAPRNGRYFELDELEEMIDGYMEIVRLIDNDLLVVDEDGRNKHKQTNAIATEIARTYEGIAPNDFIFGDALITDIELMRGSDPWLA